MNKKDSTSRKKDQPLPEPEYFDELFPALEDMPDPWVDDPPGKARSNTGSADGDSSAMAEDNHPEALPEPNIGHTSLGKVEIKRQAKTVSPVSGNSAGGEKTAALTKRTGGKTLPHSGKGESGSGRFANRPNKPVYRGVKKNRLEKPGPSNSRPVPVGIPRTQVENRPPRIGVKPQDQEVAEKLANSGHPAKTERTESLDWPLSSKPAETPQADAKPQWYYLDEVIQAHQPLPENAIILGVGEDGKPLVLSFEEPSTGGILILGDSQRDNRKHLQAMLSSVGQLNKKGQVSIDVVSPETENFKAASSLKGKICEPDSETVYELLGDILETLEKRGLRRPALPIRILVLDQIETLVANLAPESLSYLRWILRRGPQAGIWPIATLASEYLSEFDLKTFRSFGLRLCGKITDPGIADRYSNISGQVLKKLLPGSQACLKVEEEVIQFSIPHF